MLSDFCCFRHLIVIIVAFSNQNNIDAHQPINVRSLREWVCGVSLPHRIIMIHQQAT